MTFAYAIQVVGSRFSSIYINYINCSSIEIRGYTARSLSSPCKVLYRSRNPQFHSLCGVAGPSSATPHRHSRWEKQFYLFGKFDSTDASRRVESRESCAYLYTAFTHELPSRGLSLYCTLVVMGFNYEARVT